MFERFTEKARQVVVRAQDEARGMRHNYMGTEHLLLGLLVVEEGLASHILINRLHLTSGEIRERVRKIVGEGDVFTAGQIPLTPRTKKVLEFALREALSLGHNYIGTEHVLLGLVRENEGVAARILGEYEIDPQKVRNEVLRELSGTATKGLLDLVTEAKDLAIDQKQWDIAASLRAIEKKMSPPGGTVK
jgi:ATP-dependent Clp protease ATP-binding subunit ClpC